jgi:hypothetical protein
MLAIKAGFETTDPITRTHIVVVKGAEETSGRGWVTEVYCPQGATTFPAHVHETWTETFEILEGSATCRIGARGAPTSARREHRHASAPAARSPVEYGIGRGLSAHQRFWRH